MKPSDGSIYDLLNGVKQYIVPVYQRKYSWLKNDQCARLWKDIVALERSGKHHHFVGSVVNIAEKNTPMGIQQYLIIDGQQRMTTLSILMLSLRDYLYENPSDEVNPDDLTTMLLKNDKRKGDERYKMILTGYDKEVFINLIERAPIDECSKSSNIYQNYQYFIERIKEGTLHPLQIYESIEKLQIISITLSREDGDEPQAIFESLNSTGMDLSQSDLIRNYLLMGLNNDEQNDIFTHFWNPMEEMFPNERRSMFMDRFFRDYLTMKMSRIPNQEAVYDTFKSYSINNEFSSAKELAQDIFGHAKCYTSLAYGKCPEASLETIFANIRELRMEVAYPFLMKVYGDYNENIITLDEFKCILKMAESYVVRRAVCEIPTNSMNKTFAIMRNSININSSEYLNSVKAAFIQLDSYKEFPNDASFKSYLERKEIYRMHIANYILVKLENHDNKEPIALEGFTIEHILPQNENLKEYWRNALGNDWQELQKIYIHRLGNLTLTKYNSEMGDKPFGEKLPVFKQSATHYLNKYVVEQMGWGVAQIDERAKELIDIALKVWEYPSLTQEELNPYLPKVEETAPKYSINSYDFSNVFVKMLYEKLDAAILALNPAIKREYKKLYIAYKLKTNVVDVVILKSRLRLTVNLFFSEVNDPTHICKDITDVGRWGNGDVEIEFETLANLDETIKIIEQSLNKQL